MFKLIKNILVKLFFSNSKKVVEDDILASFEEPMSIDSDVFKEEELASLAKRDSDIWNPNSAKNNLINLNREYIKQRDLYFKNGRRTPSVYIKNFYGSAPYIVEHDHIPVDINSAGNHIFQTYILKEVSNIIIAFEKVLGTNKVFYKKNIVWADGGGFRNLTSKVNGGAAFSLHFFGLALDLSFNQFIKSEVLDKLNVENFAKKCVSNKEVFNKMSGLRLMFYPRHVHFDFSNYWIQGLTYVSYKPSYNKPEVKRLYTNY